MTKGGYFTFDRDFDWWVPGRAAVLAFKAGTTVRLTGEQMASAQAAGVGQPTDRHGDRHGYSSGEDPGSDGR